MAQFYSAKRRVTTRQIITVTVNSLDSFGQGVAKHNGKTVFIPGALPGEQVEARLEEDKRHFASARVTRRLNDSPQRVAPRCPHFGVCGGCQQQHVSETLQQQSKAQALSRMMKQEVTDIISGPAWGYRRRARLGLNVAPRSQALHMGFRKAGSNDLVDIHQCPVLVPQLEALLAPLRECLSGLQSVRRLGHAELVMADNGPLMVLRHLSPLPDADLQKLEQFSHSHQLALFLAPDSEILSRVCGDSPWYESDGLRLSFSPRDFIQVNGQVNQQMVARALAWLDIQPADRVLDLFCGMGNFTLPLARRAASVVGVEGVAALVAKGEDNAAANALKNVTFFHANLEEDVTRQPWAGRGFTKILLDPARAGAAGVMQHIITLAPEKVVYVSCNPSTLARDSEQLRAAGYHVAQLAMLDMFPHTGHLESMALFERG
ncbi:23S rRNA (uracil(1939)-C(5))-methyltransferase RlmD [Shimwellia blattae]|uniref:23S rRNA (uracil(1939)-C(5))-methyltransferase RlmD n=1 Tax=Shimwellia blattae (strain ATCC 29907 / DSM 4481 / JCM 1650 / NBRC 105725 / CDC 9005-74) TaxID=630626 RepID=I2B608_SHIBC|nr:23S rRNA (uracil(1939)-C(5))-methyltransferase RlmD [Shimwellia blattae]AFJ45962.1 23S rRNA (uracil-5-)-methyltransferase RumA [Shimwellia blattae DSM 4481 = NBRC 105725]GAB81717.1 23S rRNA (uracil-5-)-methyltransferase RumA [Shimwellia blattae DSM 4481 = NBRC 105725]VDY63438.1 23S rRNA (uracil(1939)-C(5))-methyltransferase RlmD [Shimwellia blattae]VEC21331.1 23S rRNA (uracil(1939)-C(5))-methyltransferase RlmD [Shimwellia blattae]